MMTTPKQEFHILIFAGGSGSRLYPITEDVPKALLPVANRPLISYPLELIEKSGFTEVTIVTVEQYVHKISKYTKDYPGKLEIGFEVFKEQLGTAEVLRKLKDKIKTDFIVMSVDTIADDSFIRQILDKHRTRDAALTMLIKQPTAADQQPIDRAEVIKKKSNFKEVSNGFDFITLDAKKEKILQLTSGADIDDEYVVKKSLLKNYPSLKLSTQLKDAHFYVMARWTLELLDDHPASAVKRKSHFRSIKGELVPYLISVQSNKKHQQSVPAHVLVQEVGLAESMSSSRSGESQSKIDCYVEITTGFCTRVNTLSSYMEANRDIARAASVYLPREAKGKSNFVAESAQVHPQTQIGADCVLGAGSKVGERTSVKKSIIGRHCIIGDNVKLSNTVIMDHVTIANGVTISDSIICDNVVIKENCNIKDSQIGVGYKLAEKSDIKNDSLHGRSNLSS